MTTRNPPRKATPRRTSRAAAPAPAPATAAPKAAPQAAAPRPRTRTLRGISDLRRFLYRNRQPIYFISATNFNLLGIDEWVGNFFYINSIDCFDGAHPSVLVPRETDHEPFTGIEDINNYLLGHKEVVELVRARAAAWRAADPDAPREGEPESAGKAVFLMFDQRTEALARALNLEVCFPSAELRARVDDKINATRLARAARVPCVPNILAKVTSYDELRRKSRRLGEHLVVQTAFGDSGHTTFFISTREDFQKHEQEILEAPEVKIMKRIRCRGSAIEACVTRHGTIVGPLMTELVGFPQLTPYKGGWCGNEVFPAAFDRTTRNRARRYAQAIGEQLRSLGYKGYFEIDFLTDLDTGNLYFGELNPRITGASSMTNLAAFAHADAPLFLFHLMEWMRRPYAIDPEELNARWADPDNIDTWSQLVLKHTKPDIARITEAPRAGIWELTNPGSARFLRVQTHRRTVAHESQGFYLRIAGPGDWQYKGGDLGILVSRGRFMTDDFELSARADAWIKGIRAHYHAAPPASLPTPPHRSHAVAAFKIS